MAAVAAMAAGGALAVESQNIVGYQLIPVPTGFSLFTPTFEGIGDNLDLTSIQICDSKGNVREDMFNEVYIQKMDASGAYLQDYAYSPTFGGWNVSFTPIEEGDVDFIVGETICVGNNTDGVVYFKVSGQVDLVNKNEVGTGFVLWGNSTPNPIDLTEVSIVDVNGDVREDMFNEVYIQKMDASGAYLQDYAYSPTFGGWNVSFTAIEEGDVTLDPGEAVCVGNNSGDTVYFKLPNPLN